MKKSILALVIACVCALAALCVVGCGSSEPSKSSSEKMEVTAEPSSTKKVIETDPVYILAVGNDSRYQTAEDEGKIIKDTDPSYSDTIMLLHVDPKTNYISILSIPRDTAVDVPNEPSKKKINDIHYISGIKGLTEYVEGMFNIKIPYYFDLHFVDFANLIDKMGGVTMNVPMDITGGDIITDEDISLNQGENTLGGNAALMLVRQRKIYSDNGEAVRQMLSRELVANAIQEFAKKPASEAAGTAKILESFGETNMPEDVLTAYISAFMNNSNEVNFNLGTCPYVGGIDDTTEWRVPADSELYGTIHEAMEKGTPLSDLVQNPAI